MHTKLHLAVCSVIAVGAFNATSNSVDLFPEGEQCVVQKVFILSQKLYPRKVIKTHQNLCHSNVRGDEK